MQSVYEPKGKAREYCERAVNLYRGCAHGCTYCYAPGALHMLKEAFACAEPRLGIVGAIQKDAPRHAGREVLMCFTTDPYQPGCASVTRGAILALQKAGCVVLILTKGGLRSAVDFDVLRPGIDKYGASLTFLRAADSLEWEPGAALPADRIAALEVAHSKGIKTWASLEPVIDPDQSLALITSTRHCVDHFKIGRWNHDLRAHAIDWRKFANDAQDLCKSLGVSYMLKEDLVKYL